MADENLLQMIETMRASEASPQRLYGDAGSRMPGRRGATTPEYARRLSEAVTFIADVMEGKTPYHRFQEAMTTADFPLLFGDVLDRQLLAAYREAPSTYRSYCKISTVPDFRNVSRFAVDGADGILAVVNEQAEYPETNVNEQRDQFSVQKRGRRLPFSWESIINDDLGGLRDMPARLARAARRSEESFATGLFCSTAGPTTGTYSTANGNLATTATGDGVFSIQTLQAMMTLLAEQTDPGGEPILTDVVHLVVPPALEISAMNVLNGLELRLVGAGGSTQQTVVAQNWMKNRLQLHVNRYIPSAINAGNRGNTSFFMFGNPADSRPSIEIGFLRGHAEPEIWIKRPNAIRAGGGDVSPLEGDFDTDSIQYRVRHVFGGAALSNTGGFRNTVGFQGST